MATVSIKSLGKTFPGGVAAVGDASVEIADGEFMVLVGPSGCGKSTMLRMIAGLETITKGELLIGGVRMNEVEPGERDIAMVFQNYALYPHMTVRRNMEYGLRNEGVARAEIARRIAEAARMLRLEDYLARRPRQLSGGQRQRVAMGRAIVRQPKVFLFDEPLSNLDAKLRTQLRAELKALHARLSGTFVYVTHDQVEAMSLADRIIVMNQGRVEQIGAPMDLYARPETRFVAEFIGSPAMNIIEGEVAAGADRLVQGEAVVVALDRPLPARPGQRVALGLRPEHLRLGHDGPVRLAMTKTFEERLGADTVIHGPLEGGDAALAFRLDGSAFGAEAERLALSCAAEDVHLFDLETGARIG